MNLAPLPSMDYGLQPRWWGVVLYGAKFLVAIISQRGTPWQGNKFAESSITPFVRYSVYDTAENEGGDYERTQVTYGVHMLLSEQFA